jgi:hypothetical protein
LKISINPLPDINPKKVPAKIAIPPSITPTEKRNTNKENFTFHVKELGKSMKIEEKSLRPKFNIPEKTKQIL